MTYFNKISEMMYALKLVPGGANVRVPHGDGASIKYALKIVPGLADVGVLPGDGDGPRTPPRCLKRSGKSFK